VSVNRTATFTDRQYVVTTEACREDAREAAHLFRSVGVGVAVLDDTGALDVIVEAETSAIEDHDCPWARRGCGRGLVVERRYGLFVFERT